MDALYKTDWERLLKKRGVQLLPTGAPAELNSRTLPSRLDGRESAATHPFPHSFPPERDFLGMFSKSVFGECVSERSS